MARTRIRLSQRRRAKGSETMRLRSHTIPLKRSQKKADSRFWVQRYEISLTDSTDYGEKA